MIRPFIKRNHWTKLVLISAALAAVFALAACGSHMLALDTAEDGKSMDMTAQAAEEGDFASAGVLAVEEGEGVTAEAEIEGDGEVEIKLIPAAALEEDEDEDPDTSTEDIEMIADADVAVRDSISGTGTKEYSLAPGDYYVAVTAVTEVTGSLLLTVRKTEGSGGSAGSGEGEETAQNPAADYAGTYVAGRGQILIEAEGSQGIRATVTWSSSAAENSVWTMTGVFDPDARAFEYEDCTKTDNVYGEDGNVASAKEAYAGGHGRISFSEDQPTTLTWQDDQEGVADGVTFELIPR